MQESADKTTASTAQAGASRAVQIQNLSFSYGSSQALKNISLDLDRNAVTAFIGPSGCGKSTLLRCINRMNDEIVGARVTEGKILVDDIDI
ncbi:MAG: ATP-binding cassette domain-containing protein, partial [Luteolibacter sp.]